MSHIYFHYTYNRNSTIRSESGYNACTDKGLLSTPKERSMRLVVLATLYWTAFFGSTASAQTECSDANNQRDINACYIELYKQADTALQSTYDTLRKKLPPEGSSTLREAQRAWVAYKENWCKLQASPVQSGSMYPSVLAQCLTELTNEQLKRLSYQNACKEDVDCASKQE